VSRVLSHVVLITVQGLGAGAGLSNGENHRRGNSTVAHVADYVGGLSLPTLAWLGLGNTAAVRGLAPAEPPAASWGIIEPDASPGALAGHTDALQSLLRGAGLSAVIAGADLDVAAPPTALFRRVTASLERASSGLIIARFDPESGHSPSPVTMARRLSAFDAALGDWLDTIGQDRDVLVLVTSATGLDPVLHASSAPAGEPTALLAFSPLVPSGVSLGQIDSLADVMATAAEALGATMGGGRSFLGAVIG